MQFEFNEQELTTIINALVQLPFKDVAGLLNKINDTIQISQNQTTGE
jgi:hypothetical protein